MKYEQISVVLPCFNEGKTIHGNLEKIHHYLEANFKTFEIIAVNDGSTDDTLNELKRFQAKSEIIIIDRKENIGKGRTVKEGILATHFDPVMFLDADLAIPVQEIGKFMDVFSKGFDLVIASRFVDGVKVIKPVIWYRKIMENIFRYIRIAILNTGSIRDTQCGFKVFKKSCAISIFTCTTINRFAFDSEVIFLAEKMKLRIKELPISLQNPRLSHIRIVKDSTNMFFDLIRIRINNFQGKYKICHEQRKEAEHYHGVSG
jgi:glycosyltransferase involved in cell wall biosynthesis